MEAIVNFEPCHIFLVSAFFSFRVKIKSEALFCCHSKWRRLLSREDFSIVQNGQRLLRIHDSITEVKLLMAMTLLGAVANYCWERKQTKTLWSQVRPTPARCGQSFFKAKFLSNCSRLGDRLSSSNECISLFVTVQSACNVLKFHLNTNVWSFSSANFIWQRKTLNPAWPLSHFVICKVSWNVGFIHLRKPTCTSCLNGLKGLEPWNTIHQCITDCLSSLNSAYP